MRNHNDNHDDRKFSDKQETAIVQVGLAPKDALTAEAYTLWTPEDAAKYLNMSPGVVRQLMRDGEIPACKIGGSWRTKKEILDEYVENKIRLALGNNDKGSAVSGPGNLQAQARGARVGKGGEGQGNGSSGRAHRHFNP